MSEALHELVELNTTAIWDGVTARMVEGERMTLAIVEIAPGKRVPEHHHDNEQIGFVIRGTVTFTVGDEVRTVGPGGSWCIRSEVPHQCDVGPEGAIVAEAYAPGRADWAQLPKGDPTKPVWPSE